MQRHDMPAYCVSAFFVFERDYLNHSENLWLIFSRTRNSRKERKNFVNSVFSVFKISPRLCASVCRTQSRKVFS